jgi:hypothetical protein
MADQEIIDAKVDPERILQQRGQAEQGGDEANGDPGALPAETEKALREAEEKKAGSGVGGERGVVGSGLHPGDLPGPPTGQHE